ncbi:hypothetical protein EV182_004439 [Spiromyces aspiralis]|uniref:Uncharacterized protein n=1 Tax=Spiromyces aspiralis TaxID=68401 RepID=A0ACC1HRF5_9FUNG|nr:hypothetical protein EV182_004439 [Spiromyces aspiralis]
MRDFQVHNGHKSPTTHKHDVAILVQNQYADHTPYLPMTSERVCVTFIDWFRLTVINVHAPTLPVQGFFDDLSQNVTQLRQAGWTTIVTGNFNLSRLPQDRSKNRTDANIMACTDELNSLIYTNSLVDMETHLAPPANNETDCYTFCHSMSEHRYWTSRIDYVMVPSELLGHPNSSYSTIPHNNLDHKSLMVVLVPPSEAPPQTTKHSYRALHNEIGAKRHCKKVNKILADGLEQMTKAWDHDPEKLFPAFSGMLAEVLEYFQRDERQWDKMQLKELGKLLSQHRRESKQCRTRPQNRVKNNKTMIAPNHGLIKTMVQETTVQIK